MNIIFIIAMIVIVLLVYGGLTYSIGLAGLRFFTAAGFNPSAIIYWIIVGLIAFAFFIARGADRWLPSWLSHSLELVGAYWLGIMTYLTMILFIGKILLLVNRRLQFIPAGLIDQPNFSIISGVIAISLVLIILLVGSWNARNPHIIHYEVQLDKIVEEHEELKIVMLSDLHLGRLVNRKQLEKIVDQINQLEADLILMPGDIIDDRIDAFVQQDMMSVFRKLKSNLGIYASMGNHEYIGGQIEKAEKYFNEAGINVLRDEHIKIEEQFYIVGREDKSFERFQGTRRKSLAEILENVDNSKPIIMLDHQPVDIEEAMESGVDLQLSGHTHRGQLFPFRIFTRKLFQVDWGYETFQDLHVIVTSGAGTWGPPLRVGHRSEILSISIKFQ
ncbi:metallophosphoesterase [Alkaliphilus transvaalensis]|uniref:metallophosphoesterase n=1 Tax=Alkaliphilus transvaalensis TaxID=114628 RepID=UPI000687DC0B|nr:metallophosphoesterase [Alkaliphilus transvaalensis]